MAVTASIAYGTWTSMTITLSSLASSSTLLTGRASTAVDNTSALAVDYLVGGKIVTTATTTANTQILIYVYAFADGTNYTGGATGTDAALTVDSGERGVLPLLLAIPNITTTAVTYNWGPVSVAQAFGGTMPSKWGLFVTQNTNTALASGSAANYLPINYTSA